jgi:hypothetical protein
MIFLSFNSRGVEGAHKILSLKRLVQLHGLNVIFIQETMCYGVKEEDAFRPWLKECLQCSVDSIGLSGVSSLPHHLL